MSHALPSWHRLGRLQLQLMQLLWQKREATVFLLHQELGSSRNLAYTTIATMLRKMEDKGLVAHRTEGRTFVYFPLVKAEAVIESTLKDLVDRFFAGSRSSLVSHLLSIEEIDRKELLQMEKLIAQKKRQA